MERLFRTVKISDRLPDMGKRVMFLDENYKDEIMHDYHPKERLEIKKNKFIELQACHFVTDYLKNNYTSWLEEVNRYTPTNFILARIKELETELDNEDSDYSEASCRIRIDELKNLIE